MKVALLWLCLALPAVAAEPDEKARELASLVFNASGGERWRQLSSIWFTCTVAQGEKALLSAAHDWHVQAGYDVVAWGGERWAVSVPGHENDPADKNRKAAYERWVNDACWLLIPRKLKDPGDELAYGGSVPVEGKQYEVLVLNAGIVGLTPTGRCKLFIDPVTHLVGRWEYLPRDGQVITGTCDGYRTFNGLTLPTGYRFGDKRMRFTNVRVRREWALLSARTQLIVMFLCITGWMLVWGLLIRGGKGHVPGPHGAGAGDVMGSANRWRSYRGPPH